MRQVARVGLNLSELENAANQFSKPSRVHREPTFLGGSSSFLCVLNCLAGLLKSVLGPPPRVSDIGWGGGGGMGENLHS